MMRPKCTFLRARNTVQVNDHKLRTLILWSHAKSFKLRFMLSIVSILRVSLQLMVIFIYARLVRIPILLWSSRFAIYININKIQAFTATTGHFDKYPYKDESTNIGFDVRASIYQKIAAVFKINTYCFFFFEILKRPSWFVLFFW